MDFSTPSRISQFPAGIDEQKILRGKILIVDDTPANIQILAGVLQKSGYRNIHSTSNPLEVRALYREISFDAILLDIHMPSLDGFGVLQQLQQEKPAQYLPVLVLTADQSKAIKHKALQNGAQDFLSKPFDRDEVLCRVRISCR